MRLVTRSLWSVVVVASLALGLSNMSMAGTKTRRPIATGKDFFIVFPQARWGNQAVGVLINSPSKQKVQVTTPTGAKGFVDFTKPKTTKYYGGQFRIQSVPGYRPREATRITSPNPISVHGQFGIQGISGTYTAIPVSAWGNEYYAIAPPEGTNSGYYYYPTIYSVPMITIIASHAGTSVTITPTAATSKGYPQDVPFTINLGNVGDVYNVTTQGDPAATNHYEDPCDADLTGTHIVSNYPIGVICAQTHGTWPCGDNECGDYCVEYIPPVCNWDSLYVITPSVPRLNNAVGEQLRIVFGHGGTTLSVDDVGGHRDLGTYGAGDWIDYPQPIGDAIVMSASHPFLPVEITRKPVSCFAGTSGGENWTLGMVVLSGVNQWGDYTPFSTAVGSQSVANVFFRENEKGKIRLNGTLLVEQFPIVKRLPLGFATIPIQINAAQYNELTGDSGATAGGSIFGFGTNRFSPRDDNGKKVQDPEVIKSFGHPIGVNALPVCNPDVTPPHITAVYNCGHWDITAMDDEVDPPATGVFDVYFAFNGPPDTSYNVQFQPAPTFNYGDSRTIFGIDVINNLQDAQAALHIRDGAGNEYDTILTYIPPKVTATPSFLDVGALRVGDSTTITMVLKNLSNVPATFKSYRLRYGQSHHWSILQPPSPPQQFTIAPGDSVTFMFQYNAPDAKGVEFDNDTLFVTTCKEFPVANLLGQPKKPGIFTQCYNFGNATIDLLTSGGDTLSSGKNVWVASIGSDTLHISGLTLQGTIAPPDANYPGNTFWFGTFKTSKGTPLAMPAPGPGNEWLIAPGDTVYVEVIGHPHHTGPSHAIVQFVNDANGILIDTACLDIFGLSPGILAKGIDYGTHLYATTVDSFFVVRNTGSVKFDILKDGIAIVDPSQDTAAFVLRDYRDPVTQSNIHYDSTSPLTMYPADPTRGLIGDTVRIPYRFISKKLGNNVQDLKIVNETPDQPTIRLQGLVIQPHIAASGTCVTDSIFLGSTTTQDVMVTNLGTAPLTIDQVNVGGPDGPEWTVAGWKLAASNAPVTLPFTLRPAAPGQNADTVIGTLRFAPIKINQSLGTVQFIGRDDMNRHAADSANGTYYSWGTFPYDTTIQICNRAYATGMSVTDLHLEQYVTRDTVGTIMIQNTGGGNIDVSDIQCTDPDFTNGFLTYTLPQNPPFTVAQGSSVPMTVTFHPDAMPTFPKSDGRRNYAANFTIINSTGTPKVAHFTGRGHMVDMHTFIPRNYEITVPNTDAVVEVDCDKWTDTLGNADMRGYIFEMTHYDRTVVTKDSAFNESRQGGIGTTSQGAVFAENVSESNMQDSLHVFHSQGYYELNIQNAQKNVGVQGLPWLKLRFRGHVGLNHSDLIYGIKNPTDVGGVLMEYLNITQSPGYITVDSVCGMNISKVQYAQTLSLEQNAPNPFVAATGIHFGQPGDGHVKLTVINSVGDIVATLVDQDLTQGQYNVSFDATGFPSGLYTYRLETSAGNMQRQMMLVR